MSMSSPSSETMADMSLTDNVFRRLNEDILLEIFSCCRDVDFAAIWAISHTCSNWRQIALEHSSLWTRVAVDRSTIRYLGSSSVVLWLDEWIQRTGQDRALDIVIDFLDIATAEDINMKTIDIHKVLLFASRQAWRWRSFTYTLDNTNLQRFSDSRYDELFEDMDIALHKLPLLQSICFSVILLDPLHIEMSPGWLHSLLCSKEAPRLRSVSLTNITSAPPSAVWTVDSLSYNVRLGHTIRLPNIATVLHHYSSVRTLSLSGTVVLPYPQAGTTSTVTLGRLEVLKTGVNKHLVNALHNVDMPCLSQLILDSDAIRNPFPWAEAPYCLQLLDDLAQRPSATLLTTISLRVPELPWKSLIRFKTLETLRITKSSNDLFWLQYPSPLSTLSKRSDGGQAWALPQLLLLILEETQSATLGHFAPSEGSSLLVSTTQVLFRDRWHAAKENKDSIASLRIQIIGWKSQSNIVIRDVDDDTFTE